MQVEVVFLLLFGFCHSAPHEGFPLLNAGGIGGIFKGPNSETIIIGPDGSEITSEERSGAIIRDDSLNARPIVVSEPGIELAPPEPILTEKRIVSAAPIIVSTGAPIISPAAPVLSSTATPLLTGEIYDVRREYIDAPLPAPVEPIVPAIAPVDVKPIEIVEQDPHIIETEIIEAPDIEPEQNSDLKGPSGRIITKGSASIVSGPASTTITEPRKIIVAPPKLLIDTPAIAPEAISIQVAPLVAPLPALRAATVAPLPELSVGGSSTVLSYSTTSAPVELGYSTSAAPLAAISSTVDTKRIDLGLGGRKESIPVVEYSSSNGIISGQNVAGLSYIASTESPIISSTISAITTDKFAPAAGPAVPLGILVPPPEPRDFSVDLSIAPRAEELVSSSISPNIQRIGRIDNSVAVDGRVDMGYPSTPSPYRLPQVLSEALTTLYQKEPVNKIDTTGIDDKMGDLSNEIEYDTRNLLTPPDLSQSRYLGPVLQRNGIDASQVNLERVALSQVTRLDGGYSPGISRGYLSNRYERNAQKRN